MKKIKEVVIVEGKYDRNTLSQVVDCTIIETSGFGVFNDKQKAELIRRLAEKRGIIVLTDSDGAGFVIRNHIKGIVKDGCIKQAYIPDIYGKERRKNAPSKEGKLGVEGMRPEIILEVLRKAGATFEDEEASSSPRDTITKADFYELGLSGKPDCAALRAKLIKKLDLPEKISANALLDVVNSLYSKDELYSFVNTL